MLYFRSLHDSEEVWATYVVVPPIALDLSKYIPPMFASQLPLQSASALSAYPLPPLPEKVPGYRWLENLARVRNDDLLDGGTIDPSDLQRMMLTVTEAAQRYAAWYAEWAARAPEPEPEPLGEIDVDELFYSLMSDRERVSRLAKLVGNLRYALDGGDARAVAEAADEMRKIGRHLDAAYRVEGLIRAAQQPGETGRILAELYVERAYKVAAEEYGELGALEARIAQLEQA